MRLTSRQTSHGAATVAIFDSPIHPVKSPIGWGLVLWGRANRIDALTVACNSKAAWVADYDPNQKAAVVVWSAVKSPQVGDLVTFETADVDSVVCPGCGSGRYVANGLNWLCKDCGRQWRKVSKRAEKPAERSSG